MIAVIFETTPRDGRKDDYLQAAAQLKPMLEQLDGFISIERFSSISQPHRILSLSFWRDEAAISRWRNMEAHREVQAAGRKDILADYRLRVAHVVRDYGMNQRTHAPADSKLVHGVASSGLESHHLRSQP
jgi:heme-degrading monooxygenase HmoA